MASTERLPSGRYRGVYYLAERPGEKPRKRRVKGTFTHKRAAERAAIEAEGRSIGDPQHDPNTGRMTWESWEKAWTPSRSIAPRTRARAESLIRVHVGPRWNRVQLVEIAHHDVQVWVNGMGEQGVGPGTARKAYFELSASLKAALRAGHVRTNACTGVVLPTPPSAPERFLADDEVDRLFARIEGRYRVLVELLLATGLRLSEAIGLHWQRVDFDARVIRVAEQWDPEVSAVIAVPKGKAARTVPMTDDLAARLKAWARECPPTETCGLVHDGLPCRSSLVVPAPRGGAIDAHNFYSRAWSSAVCKSKIGHCRPHDLRHTWASRLVTAGVPLERLQVWGGWESYSVVLRYAHLMTDDHDLYREALANRGRRPLRAVK